MGKFNVKSFALAAGIYGAGCVALVTIAALLKIPGFQQFANSLTNLYGFYGYSITGFGIFVGAFWGFIEGFFHFGIFALIYNFLSKKLSQE